MRTVMKFWIRMLREGVAAENSGGVQSGKLSAVIPLQLIWAALSGCLDRARLRRTCAGTGNAARGVVDKVSVSLFRHRLGKSRYARCRKRRYGEAACESEHFALLSSIGSKSS